MKITAKAFLAGIAATLLVAGSSLAAETPSAAVFTANDQVWVEGRRVLCQNESGTLVPYLSYNDSTYIPLRTAGQWAGKQVSWNQEAQSISLAGTTEQLYFDWSQKTPETPSQIPAQGSVEIALRPDIQVLVDGKEQQFTNQRGEPIVPIQYQDVTYLPLRSIGQLTGLEVTWVRPTPGAQVIYLRTPVTAQQQQSAKDFITQEFATLQQWKALLKDLAQRPQDGALLSQQVALLEGLQKSTTPQGIPCLAPALAARQEFLGQALAQAKQLAQTPEAALPTLDTLLTATYGQLVEMSKALEQTGFCTLVPHLD